MDWNDVKTINLLQLAIEALPSGILLVNPWGVIALVNREAERQFGYSREELIGQAFERLLPEARAALAAIKADHVSTDSHAATTRTIGVRRDGGRFTVDLQLKPIRTAEAKCVLATVVGPPVTAADAEARAEAAAEQLAFERLSSEIAGEFLNLPDSDLHDAMAPALSRVCSQFGLDAAAFCRLTAEGTQREIVGWSTPPLAVWRRDTLPFPRAFSQVLSGELFSCSQVSELSIDGEGQSLIESGIRSMAHVPLRVEGHVAGALCVATVRAERPWQPRDLERLRLIAHAFEHFLARRHRDEALQGAIAEVKRMREQLQAEAAALRPTRRTTPSLHPVSESPAGRRVMQLIEQVANTDSTVLLLGETGTGKELFASQIHELSARRNRPMIRVNCAAIPATLIESELFGREKGAFTGALARQIGRFELADKGTIFLDEIGDLPLDVQVKLLRVLEEGQIERLGSPRSIPIDTRIIAATHQDLQQRIAEGAFREDLFYRLNVFPIRVPALRERVEDIPHLVWQFASEFSKAFGRRIESISSESLAPLQQYPWPGNIRELRNTVERAMIVSHSPKLSIAVPPASNTAARRSLKLIDVEKQHMRAVLESSRWRIRGEGGAAARLGLKPTTLETRMARLGLKRPEHP